MEPWIAYTIAFILGGMFTLIVSVVWQANRYYELAKSRDLWQKRAITAEGNADRLEDEQVRVLGDWGHATDMLDLTDK